MKLQHLITRLSSAVLIFFLLALASGCGSEAGGDSQVVTKKVPEPPGQKTVRKQVPAPGEEQVVRRKVPVPPPAKAETRTDAKTGVAEASTPGGDAPVAKQVPPQEAKTPPEEKAMEGSEKKVARSSLPPAEPDADAQPPEAEEDQEILDEEGFPMPEGMDDGEMEEDIAENEVPAEKPGDSVAKKSQPSENQPEKMPVASRETPPAAKPAGQIAEDNDKKDAPDGQEVASAPAGMKEGEAEDPAESSFEGRKTPDAIEDISLSRSAPAGEGEGRDAPGQPGYTMPAPAGEGEDEETFASMIGLTPGDNEKAAEGYVSKGKVDPFAPLFQAQKPPSKEVLESKAKQKDKEKIAKKKPERIKTSPLEKFDLNQLRLVGVILAASGDRALIQAPNNKGFIVKRGDWIGIHNGRVTDIKNNMIVVHEEDVDRINNEIRMKKRVLELQGQPKTVIKGSAD